MERRRGLWIASTPAKPWVSQGRPVAANRTADTNLQFDGITHQLWEGFGGGLSEIGWESLSSLRGMDGKRVAHALFNHEEGCCFHYGRIPIGASNLASSLYSHDDVSGDLALKHYSVAHDRERLLPFLRLPLGRIRKFKVVACPWSPPDWMKEPSRDGAGKILWTPVVLEAYAHYLARFVEEYNREGVAVDHLLVQNEPAAAERRPGCLWTGAQLRDFIRNYLGPVFQKRRIPTRVWLGALATPQYSDHILTVLSDPMARQLLVGVACQHGGREMLARISRAFPDLLLMQSDCNEGDGANSWEEAHGTFAVVQQAILAGACTCVYENMIFPDGGLDGEGRGRNSLIAVNRDQKTFSLTPDYHVFRHFSCMVDRYAVRLGLTGEWADRAVAFYNEKDESRVLVLHNPDPVIRRVVVGDGDRRQVLVVQPQSFNTVVL